MNVSDYILNFIANKGVTHIFGYQGTMIAYFVDAISRNSTIENHSCYNEQGAAFAACGYAQASERCAVAYATSGPGAVNLLSGVANAHFDSTPVIFITGQLNTYEYAGIEGLRQQGFQEIDIVSMAKPITKYAVHVTDAYQACYEFEKAWYIANSGRKGAVLFDIPMNIQREEIRPELIQHYKPKLKRTGIVDSAAIFSKALNGSKRPLFLIGNGVSGDSKDKIVGYAEKYHIPIVTSLLQRALLPDSHPLNFGFIGGAYGMRIANLLAAAKADLLVCIGVSLCTRQTGTKVNCFAKEASILRVDCDKNVLQRRIKENEISLCLGSEDFINDIVNVIPTINYENWFEVASACREYCSEFDEQIPERYTNRIIQNISLLTQEGSAVVCDVGQHMMWVAQSFSVKAGQKLLFSGGHGAMGFALPAAIGAYYGSGTQSVCISGDGAFQMNIQELQWIAREQIPITIVVMNNHVLGMITQLQDDYFEGKHYGTAVHGGYLSPDFAAIAKAYGIDAYQVQSIDEIKKLSKLLNKMKPVLIEVKLSPDTKAYPKTHLGQAIYNQMPLMPDELLNKLLEL